MSGTKKAIQSGAARIMALRSKGGSAEVRAQRRAMSKSKRVRVVRGAPKGY